MTMGASNMGDTPANIGDLPKGPRPGDRNTAFFDDHMADDLLRGIMTLAAELSVTRERLDSIEILLAQKGGIGRDDIDALQLDIATERQRAVNRTQLIDSLLSPMAQRMAQTKD